MHFNQSSGTSLVPDTDRLWFAADDIHWEQQPQRPQKLPKKTHPQLQFLQVMGIKLRWVIVTRRRRGALQGYMINKSVLFDIAALRPSCFVCGYFYIHIFSDLQEGRRQLLIPLTLECHFFFSKCCYFYHLSSSWCAKATLLSLSLCWPFFFAPAADVFVHLVSSNRPFDLDLRSPLRIHSSGCHGCRCALPKSRHATPQRGNNTPLVVSSQHVHLHEAGEELRGEFSTLRVFLFFFFYFCISFKSPEKKYSLHLRTLRACHTSLINQKNLFFFFFFFFSHTPESSETITANQSK